MVLLCRESVRTVSVDMYHLLSQLHLSYLRWTHYHIVGMVFEFCVMNWLEVRSICMVCHAVSRLFVFVQVL